MGLMEADGRLIWGWEQVGGEEEKQKYRRIVMGARWGDISSSHHS